MTGDEAAGNGTVHRLFEDWARRAPDAVAVRFDGLGITYGELDARADRLAGHLAEAGLGAGGLAAVSLGRGPDVFVAMLAVLKAGGAYVPVEPSAPDPLLRHILTDADPAVVVTHESHRVRLADATRRAVVCPDSAAAAIAARPAVPLRRETAPGDPACVFYTSGSTGLPKGAVIEHRNLVAAHRAWRQVYELSPADRLLQTASLEFDVFTADWVRALCSGATLVMARPNFTLDRTADLAELPRLVAGEGVSVLELNLHTAKRLAEHLRSTEGAVQDLAGVRLLTVGAEKWYLDEQLALTELLGVDLRVVNVYGVAEACVDSAYFEVEPRYGALARPERVSLIGAPFPGVRVYVLGADGRPAPPGEAGRIAIGGAGVGRGYLGRPELTAERFPSAAFDPDGRVHLTGDAGRLREDGLLEFIGRADATLDGAPGSSADGWSGGPAGGLSKDAAARGVVLAGAAAQAEGVLRAHPAVRECVVTEVELPSQRRALVAYVVAAGAGAPDSWTLVEHLADRLPRGSAPEAVVPLHSLPRTRAGKIDRRALPLPAPRGHAAPAGRAGAGEGAGGGTGATSGASMRAGGAKAGRRYSGGKAGGPGGRSRAGAGSDAQVSRTTWVLFTLTIGFLAGVLTDAFFPTSTDLRLVPAPWSGLFQVLYACECMSFGAGVTFLLLGLPLVRRQGRPPGLTGAAHLAIVWLLAAWWPQDNLYRTSSATDWPRQTLLVYIFNVALMAAAVVAARFVVWRPKRVL
ncbi:AMP-binding protein [Kitasatospora sp. NPDC050543]|uniref:AMP-binding protein n=1 Tax=Kitasatospora sp. NPDC050543 TaxID=3364054 RepID=UPI00379FA48F